LRAAGNKELHVVSKLSFGVAGGSAPMHVDSGTGEMGRQSEIERGKTMPGAWSNAELGIADKDLACDS
jgi:hypothetical protein